MTYKTLIPVFDTQDGKWTARSDCVILSTVQNDQSNPGRSQSDSRCWKLEIKAEDAANVQIRQLWNEKQLTFQITSFISPGPCTTSAKFSDIFEFFFLQLGGILDTFKGGWRRRLGCRLPLPLKQNYHWSTFSAQLSFWYLSLIQPVCTNTHTAQFRRYNVFSLVPGVFFFNAICVTNSNGVTFQTWDVCSCDIHSCHGLLIWTWFAHQPPPQKNSNQ